MVAEVWVVVEEKETGDVIQTSVPDFGPLGHKPKKRQFFVNVRFVCCSLKSCSNAMVSCYTQ